MIQELHTGKYGGNQFLEAILQGNMSKDNEGILQHASSVAPIELYSYYSLGIQPLVDLATLIKGQ